MSKAKNSSGSNHICKLSSKRMSSFLEWGENRPANWGEVCGLRSEEGVCRSIRNEGEICLIGVLNALFTSGAVIAGSSFQMSHSVTVIQKSYQSMSLFLDEMSFKWTVYLRSSSWLLMCESNLCITYTYLVYYKHYLVIVNLYNS